MNTDILSIDPTDNWPSTKKVQWERLKVLTDRIIENGKDLTSNLGSDAYFFKFTYAAFAEDPLANTLYHKVMAMANAYNYDRQEDEFQAAAKKTQFKTIRKVCEIAKAYDISIQFEDEPTPTDAKANDYLPEGVSESFFDTYGFFQKGNEYFTLESRGGGKWVPVPFTNFTMKVLFHMNNGMQSRRVVELTNHMGKKKTVDIQTDKLTGKGDFKKFCEGLGNFRFFGAEGKLDMIKAYLYEQENECQEINVLGWHEDGFWCWSNGIYNAKFHQLDRNGFVELHGKHYYVPSGNHEQPNRIRRFSNEIRFRHHPDHVPTFTEWARLYSGVFGDNGNIILTFAVSCLFSDIVFNIKQFFPLLFIYGEGGSGKGSAVKMAQRLFGIPQDPLTLSGKANTDKAKIAIFAQFVNSMLLLEEYTPGHDTDQLLKNLWDRYGYKRRTMDMGYGTETVPIQSGVAIIGNFSPADDPLMQRLIYLEHNVNQFTKEQQMNFNTLKDYTEAGITNCTHELLAKRPAVERRFREVQPEVAREIKSQFSVEQITDRMIENVAVLITIHDILVAEGITFPFKRDHLVDRLVTYTKAQNEKRSSGGEVQKFFEIFQVAVSSGELFEGVHFTMSEKHLAFNLKMIYPSYAETQRRWTGQPALTLQNIRDKLKIHHAFSHYEDTARIGPSRTSAYVFKYPELGIDLVSAANVQKGTRNKRSGLQQSLDEKLENEKPVNEGFKPHDNEPF